MLSVREMAKLLKSIELPEGWEIVKTDYEHYGDHKYYDGVYPAPSRNGHKKALRMFVENEDGSAAMTFAVGWNFNMDPNGGAYPEV